MRYRKLSPAGDMVFGGGQSAFLVDSPEAVAQAVQTRLRLQLGEWLLDTSDGTNWRTGVLGKYTERTRAAVIRDRIVNTPGVLEVLAFAGTYDGTTRRYAVQCTISTIYGTTTTAETL